jgi:hypothetical protein
MTVQSSEQALKAHTSGNLDTRLSSHRGSGGAGTPGGGALGVGSVIRTLHSDLETSGSQLLSSRSISDAGEAA